MAVQGSSQLVSHAPKIGDGLGVGIVRITTTRKRTTNASSMILHTKPEVDSEEEEHVFPPYKEQARPGGALNKASAAGERSRKASMVGEGRRKLE